MPRTRPRPRPVPVDPPTDRPPVVAVLEDLGFELEKIHVLAHLIAKGAADDDALVVAYCIQDTLERATRLRQRALEAVYPDARPVC
jgi:hypothetical protein